MDGTKGLKETTGAPVPVASSTLSVNVFTAPGKAMVGERPKPFGEALAFDPITSTLIFGENDAVLVDAMTTVSEAEALAAWIALHNRNLETIYITHAHFDHFYGLSILLDHFPSARAIAAPNTVRAMQMSFTPPVERLARRMFPGQVATNLVAPEPYEHDTFTLEGHELHIIQQGRTDSADSTSLCAINRADRRRRRCCTTSAACMLATPRPRAERIGLRILTGWRRSTQELLSPAIRNRAHLTLLRRSRRPSVTLKTSVGCRIPRRPNRSCSIR